MEDIDRTFKAKDRYNADMEFELRPVNLAADNEGERHYKIAYSQALKDGIFPKESLRKAMSEYGMWSNDDEREYKTLLGKIAIAQIELDKTERAGEKDRCEELAKELADLRHKQWTLFLIQQSVFTHSAEGVAEAVKMEATIAACLYIKATGQRYWKNYAEFVTERDENANSTVYINLVELQTKLMEALRQDIEGNYPESKYIKDPRQSALDRDVQAEVEVELARRAAEAKAKEEAKPKKKVTRKRAKRGKVATKTKEPKATAQGTD